MLHPFFNQSRTIYCYLAGWGVLVLGHWMVLYTVEQFGLWVALADSLVYNGIFLALSLSLWFPLTYADKADNRWMQLSNHFIVFVTYLGIWVATSWGLSVWMLRGEAHYAEFANKALVFRIIWGTMMWLFLAVLYHALDIYKDLEEKKQQEIHTKKLLKEAELKALKAQLNPHFLFNSLNSISSLTITDPDKAREMVNKLSDFLRQSLRSHNDTLHPLRDELANMERYLEIERIRFGDRLWSEFEIDDRCEHTTLPAMLLQPLYENAVKHGVYESIEPVSIRTFCQMNNDCLEISIINNYDPEAIARKGESVGLENVRNRLRMLYHTDGLIQVIRENHHFEVMLTIPQTVHHEQ
ncbi:MAG: histidine kinase [Breznakibacter sp.]